MWQRFTERARRAIFLAQEEASRLGSSEIDPQRLLLGLLRENDHVAARVLERLGVSLHRLRSEIERQAQPPGSYGVEIQLTPQVRRIIDQAHDEARQLNHNHIGTVHLLLALLRDGESVAARVLTEAAVSYERARLEVQKLHAEGEVTRGREGPPPGAVPGRWTDDARRVISIAQEEARGRADPSIDPEHLLLGLTYENDHTAARVLDHLGVPADGLRAEIEGQLPHGQAAPGTSGTQKADEQLPPRAKHVINLAYEEAWELSNNWVGTEHLLLGLIRERDGLAAGLLTKLGAGLEQTRTAVRNLQEV